MSCSLVYNGHVCMSCQIPQNAKVGEGEESMNLALRYQLHAHELLEHLHLRCCGLLLRGTDKSQLLRLRPYNDR